MAFRRVNVYKRKHHTIQLIMDHEIKAASKQQQHMHTSTLITATVSMMTFMMSQTMP